MCPFSQAGKTKALKWYVPAPLWTGREDLTSAERQRTDCCIAAYIRHHSHDIKLRVHGCLPPNTSAPSDLTMRALLAEAVQFLWAFCSPHASSGLQRTHSLLHSITLPLEPSVTFSPAVLLQLYTKHLQMAIHFLNKHLETSFEMRFFMYARFCQNYWKKCKVPQCYTHYFYFINCL